MSARQPGLNSMRSKAGGVPAGNNDGRNQRRVPSSNYFFHPCICRNPKCRELREKFHARNDELKRYKAYTVSFGATEKKWVKRTKAKKRIYLDALGLKNLPPKRKRDKKKGKKPNRDCQYKIAALHFPTKLLAYCLRTSKTPGCNGRPQMAFKEEEVTMLDQAGLSPETQAYQFVEWGGKPIYFFPPIVSVEEVERDLATAEPLEGIRQRDDDTSTVGASATAGTRGTQARDREDDEDTLWPTNFCGDASCQGEEATVAAVTVATNDPQPAAAATSAPQFPPTIVSILIEDREDVLCGAVSSLSLRNPESERITDTEAGSWAKSYGMARQAQPTDGLGVLTDYTQQDTWERYNQALSSLGQAVEHTPAAVSHSNPSLKQGTLAVVFFLHPTVTAKQEAHLIQRASQNYPSVERAFRWTVGGRVTRVLLGNDVVEILSSGGADWEEVLFFKTGTQIQAYFVIGTAPQILDTYGADSGKILRAIRLECNNTSRDALQFMAPSFVENAQFVTIRMLKKQMVHNYLQRGGYENPYREINLQSQLQDERHILPLKAAFEDSNYICMVYKDFGQASGGSLLQHVALSDRSFADSEVKDMLTNILEIIEFLAKHDLYHCALTPENLEFHNSRLLLVRMGLAVPMEHKTGPIGVKCTPIEALSFLPPEHVGRNLIASATSAHLWSAAVMLYLMLARKTPYSVPHPVDIGFEMLLSKGVDGMLACLQEASAHHCYGFVDNISKFTDDALMLLKNLLRVDPRQRLSLEAAKEMISPDDFELA